MYDEIARSVAAVARFVIFYLLWSLALFNIGRVTLLMCTLGRYPRGRALEQHADRISSVGLAVVVVLWAGIAFHNNFAHSGNGVRGA